MQLNSYLLHQITTIFPKPWWLRFLQIWTRLENSNTTKKFFWSRSSFAVISIITEPGRYKRLLWRLNELNKVTGLSKMVAPLPFSYFYLWQFHFLIYFFIFCFCSFRFLCFTKWALPLWTSSHLLFFVLFLI